VKLPPPESNAVRLLLLVLIAAGAAAFLLAGGYRYLSFDNLVAHKDALMDWADARPLLAPGIWVAAYLALEEQGQVRNLRVTCLARSDRFYERGTSWSVRTGRNGSQGPTSFRYCFAMTRAI
jgi:hypothetical protein